MSPSSNLTMCHAMSKSPPHIQHPHPLSKEDHVDKSFIPWHIPSYNSFDVPCLDWVALDKMIILQGLHSYFLPFKALCHSIPKLLHLMISFHGHNWLLHHMMHPQHQQFWARNLYGLSHTHAYWDQPVLAWTLSALVLSWHQWPISYAVPSCSSCSWCYHVPSIASADYGLHPDVYEIYFIRKPTGLVFVFNASLVHFLYDEASSLPVLTTTPGNQHFLPFVLRLAHLTLALIIWNPFTPHLFEHIPLGSPF